ncbi:MAG TPA: alpha/beta-type small acid-soluble spore protein [Firmicutes bacterium]|nr:alpha/beta-type small acid-soluble spore protein [Bacillota bacterium]
MPRNRRKLLPEHVLDTFKYEIASDLGIIDKVETTGWGSVTSRECGKVGGPIGGKMVRVMIRKAEEALMKG